MKKTKRKCIIANLILAMTILSATPALASEAVQNEKLSEEYKVTDDGYIVADEISEEALKSIVTINRKAETIISQEAQSQTVHYTIVDNGNPKRLSDDLQDWVYKMCEEYKIHGYEKVILSKLYCESNYNPNVVHRNKNGTIDYGIAQINSSNHARLKRQLGITNFMDPYQSIRAGVYMYSECLKQNGYNEEMALAAYNTGRNGISSTKYTKRVLNIKNSAFSS